jgi:hypothetical protein
VTLARSFAFFIAPLTFLTASAVADPAAAPQTGAQRLERIKSLAGTWEADADKDGKPDQTVVYRVTSAGFAVEETLFPGSDHEMVTMYVRDGDDLVLTHYCALGNQPRMKAQAGADAAKIEFAYASGGNMKSRDEQHMDSLLLTLTDATHLRHDWAMWKDGKVVQTISFDWTKKP